MKGIVDRMKVDIPHLRWISIGVKEYDAEFVGHPLAEHIATSCSRGKDFARRHGLHFRTGASLASSREQETGRLRGILPHGGDGSPVFHGKRSPGGDRDRAESGEEVN